MAYFVYFTRDKVGAPWGAQFGDTSRSTVEEEARDFVRFERDCLDRKDFTLKHNTRIVKFARVATGAEIEAARLALD